MRYTKNRGSALAAMIPLMLMVLLLALASSAMAAGVVTVTSPGGSCVSLTPAAGGGPDNWEVAEGGSYTMTITGVTECTDAAITVFVQGLSGNFCIQAAMTAPGIYSGDFTMPDRACFTYPISYKCGANQACNNSGTINARGPAGADTVHLRASYFNANCGKTGDDTVCTPTLVIQCPSKLDLGCNPTSIPGCNPDTVTTSGGCAPVVVTCGSFADTVTGCVTTRLQTYIATDACGQTKTCTQTITWKVDTQGPTITVTGGSETLRCNPTDAEIEAAFGTATATDSCGTATVGTPSDTGGGGSGCTGTRTRTWTAQDECGNVSTETRTLTWKVDTAPPVLANVPTGGDLGCNPTEPTCATDVTANDECDGPVTVTCTPGDVVIDGCKRSQTFTYSAIDACGNPVSQDVEYTWKVDTDPPVLPKLPKGRYRGCNPKNLPTCVEGLKAIDACDGPVDVTCTAGDVSSNGCMRTQTFTYSATDGCKNTASDTVTYTWKVDTDPPVLPELPKGRDLGCNPKDPPTCIEGLKAIDACDGLVDVTCTPGDVVIDGCKRSQTFTYSAIDTCENPVSTEVKYTWTENTAEPVVNCPSPITVPGSFINFRCGQYVTFDATAKDPCTDEPLTVTFTEGDVSVKSGDLFASGIHTIVATAVGTCGVIGTCNFTIEVGNCPTSTATLIKYNDVDGNGQWDPATEALIAGVKLHVCYTVQEGTFCADYLSEAGPLSITVPLNAPITICEVLPPPLAGSTCAWAQTAPNVNTVPPTGFSVSNGCYVGAIASSTLQPEFQFGNVCACAPTNGLTLGFWSNPNGRKIMTGSTSGTTLLADVQNLLRCLNLRNANGTYLYTGTTTPPPDATKTITYTQFRTWILAATATNMANMLSAQLAATALTANFTSGLPLATAVVLPAKLATCWNKPAAVVAEVICAAKLALAANGSTPSGNVDRAYQECLKTILDGINNNWYPVSTGGQCPVNTYPVITGP